MAKNLIAFYSRADENYVSGMLRKLEVGNTEVAAGFIEKWIDADVFKIEQQQAYAKDYNTCIAQAQEDQKRDARPELKAYPESIDGYETIYLGFPNYWSTMPMAVCWPAMFPTTAAFPSRPWRATAPSPTWRT